MCRMCSCVRIQVDFFEDVCSEMSLHSGVYLQYSL